MSAHPHTPGPLTPAERAWRDELLARRAREDADEQAAADLAVPRRWCWTENATFLLCALIAAVAFWLRLS